MNEAEIKVLENLSEDEAYLFAILSDPSGLDQAEFLWVDDSSEDNKFCPHCGTEHNGVHLHEHAELTKNDWVEKYPSPSVCFRAWAFQWPWWRCTLDHQVDQCIAEGQLVLTRNGWTPIERVEVGDLVLTHRNRWRPVTATFDQGLSETVVVRGQGHPGLVITEDHLLYARRSRRGSIARDGHRGKVLQEAQWMTPANWEWNDGSGGMTANWACTPTMLPDASGPPEIERTPWCDIDWRELTFLWLFGHFIAQGSTYVPKPGAASSKTFRATWSCNPERVDVVERMLDKINVKPYVERRGSVTCVNSTLKPLVVWLREQAGHLAHNKKLPNWALTLNEDQRIAIFDGMIFGDGHQRGARNDYTTSSWQLALSFKALAASLGHSVSMHKTRLAGTDEIEGRTVQRRDAWCVGVEPLEAQRKPKCVIDDHVMWAPLKDITHHGVSHVYDIEVEEDHSYVVEGVVVHNCARSVGKSLSVKVRGCAFPFLFPGQEMVITAPELIHLEPITGLIESQFWSSRVLREMLPRGRSSFTHRPFQANFVNGSRIIGRIPQRDGRGVKGIHPIWLELDEASDFPHAGWIELNETLKRGSIGAMWRAHGVTRGVRDDFYEITQDSPDNHWKIHRFAAMWRPTWTDLERQQAIQKYGSREDPDYRRNILGLHGDKTNPIFVLTQLMKNVDSDPLSDYNSGEYFLRVIKSEKLELFKEQIVDNLDFPAGHLTYAGANDQERLHNPKATFWAGMDVGFTIDPSEILVFVEHRPKPNSPNTVLRLLTRLSLVRMPHRDQIQAILHTIDFYRPRAFALDKGGVGLPLFQELSEHIEAFRAGEMDKVPAWMAVYDLESALTTIKGYSFGEKLLVELDPTVELSPYDDAQDMAAKAGLRRNAKEHATDVLREMVDRQQLWLPWDEDLLKQFQGGTWTSNRSMDAYGRRIFSRGNDHVLDAARFVALAWSQHAIEEMMRTSPKTPVLDVALMPW